VVKKREPEMTKKRGFTLIEVLIASLILTGTLAATLGLFSQSLNVTQSAGSFTKAVNTAQMQLEIIRARIDPDDPTTTINFTDLNQWNNRTFQVLQLGDNAIGVCYVQPIAAPLASWRVKVVICWRDPVGRIMGEDNGAGGGTALDGVINGAEDADNNGELDSPVQLETVLVTGGV